jgi:microcystin-dependent protein
MSKYKIIENKDVNNQGVFSLPPPGVPFLYTGNQAPIGSLECLGQAVSRTTYARLFSVIGTKYGAGNGSTTFNLPPAGIVPVGFDSTQTEFNTEVKKVAKRFIH